MAERLMSTVFDWDDFAIYLSGPMDFAHDGGKNWRDDWTERLIEIGIQSKQIYNPCKKPFHGAQFELDDEAAIGREFRKNEKWEEFYELMGQIMHIDLRLVDKADIILVNMPKIGNDEYARFLASLSMIKWTDEFPKKLTLDFLEHYSNLRVPTYGTIHEIVVAHLQRKPIFMVWEGGGLKDCSAWIMRLVGYKNIFDHIDPLIRHLEAISKGKQSFNANEWLLIDNNSDV